MATWVLSVLFFGVNVSCSRTQHGAPSEDRTPPSCLLLSQYAIFEVFFYIHDYANEIIFIRSLDERAGQNVSMVILIVF